MADKHAQQLQQLEHGISALDRAIKEWNLVDLQEILKHIRRPGWTTPAEILFSLGIVNSLVAQATQFHQLKNALLEGSRAVRTTAERES